MREESILFPRFPLCVLSPLESIVSTLCLEETKKEQEGEENGGKEGDTTLSILASLLAFLAHSSDSKHEVKVVDNLLSRLLQSIPPSSLSDWHLGPLLSGT